MNKLSFFLLILISSAIYFTGCKDDSDSNYQDLIDQIYADVYAQFGKDTVIIKQYLTDHQITATKHSSGIYYLINEPGNELHPKDSSSIEVKYKGYLTDGTIFDQTSADTTYTSTLGKLISGWRIGIPLIGKGGNITLFLPSYYGYGNEDYGAIPANSVLIFEIELIGFK